MILTIQHYGDIQNRLGGGMKEEQPCDPLTIGSFCSISVEVDAAHSERATLDLWEVADL